MNYTEIQSGFQINTFNPESTADCEQHLHHGTYTKSSEYSDREGSTQFPISSEDVFTL